ncbi:MAG: DUF2059 domain-containing protein [Burkholderiales bacterium]
MNLTRSALMVLLCCSVTAMAAPASEASVKELLAVTKAQKLLDDLRAQFDSLMSNSIQQALKGKTPTAEQQKAITKMKDKMVAVLQGELSWAKLEPMYLRLYRESFSDEEIGGMLSFYKTPAGQAVINKMPVLMQQTMVQIQNMITAINPQMQKILEAFLADMEAASK